MLLKHGCMSDEVLIVIQGEVQVLGLMRQLQQEEDKKNREAKGEEFLK